jgi:hypothetical protein
VYRAFLARSLRLSYRSLSPCSSRDRTVSRAVSQSSRCKGPTPRSVHTPVEAADKVTLLLADRRLPSRALHMQGGPSDLRPR